MLALNVTPRLPTTLEISFVDNVEALSSSGEGTTTVRGTSRTLTYLYDANANRTRVTHPDGWFFEYGFDGLDRFSSLNESANSVPTASAVNMLSVDYHPGGGRHHLYRPSGATTEYLQDNLKRLESFSQDFYGDEHDLVASFDYNPASQVIFRARSNDLYAITGTPSRAGVYQRNGLNQYTAVEGKTLGYDGNGNLTSYRDANDELVTYGYDMENRLVSATGTVGGQSVTASLTWDPLGRLHEVSINGVPRQFLYDGDALVAEYTGSTLVRRYVHGDQVDEPLVQYDSGAVGAQWRRYLHADHQGSLIAQSGHTGMVYATNAYDPYGIPAATNSGRFGYTGQAWLPELGLYHYKARVYHPRIGRFLQTDPIFYADDMNIYAYVGNDPANKRDPTGRQASDDLNDEQPESLPPGGARRTGDPGEVKQPPDSPYGEDGVTLKPAEPYLNSEQTVVGDTTGVGAQKAVDAANSMADHNDNAATARSEGDKTTEAIEEKRADRERSEYEKAIGQGSRPSLIIHPDGSVGGPAQEGDIKVPQ